MSVAVMDLYWIICLSKCFFELRLGVQQNEIQLIIAYLPTSSDFFFLIDVMWISIVIFHPLSPRQSLFRSSLNQ